MAKKKVPQEATQPALLEGFTLDPYVDMDQVKRAFAATLLALDIETETRWPGTGPEKDYGLSYASDVRVIGMAWERGSTVVVGPFDPEFKQALIERFASPNTIVAHNAVFDMRGLSRLTGGTVPSSIWCTATMARLLHPDKCDAMGYGLLAVAKALGFDTDDQQQAMKSKRAALHEQDPEQVKRYAMNDALVALQIYQAQIALVKSEPLYLMADWECRAVQAYCQMAATGVRLNTSYVQQRITELSQVVATALDQLKADGLDNPNSPKARAQYIYETKRIPFPKYEHGSPFFTAGAHKREAELEGSPYTPDINDMSTGAAVMRYLVGIAGDDSDIDEGEDADPETGKYVEQLRALADYLSASKMLATLVSLLEHASTDGKLHSLVSISTHAGRRSASHPQVQNWRMVAQDVAGDMSGVVLGDTEDSTLVEIDYSNAENWIAALLSGDDNLAKACASQDFHSAMAEQYFSEWAYAQSDRRKALRKMGKSVTFGTAYGMGPGKLAQRLGVSKEEASRILNAKDRAFPYVREAKEAVESKVKREGSVNLWTGRKVMVATNQAYRGWNYCCQGGVGELVKRAIVTITEEYLARGMQSRVALDMHDAVVISVKHSEWGEAIAIASTIMQAVMPDELNARTDPAVRWIAQPDFDDNAHKWGHFQRGLDWYIDESGDVYALAPSEQPGLDQANHMGPYDHAAALAIAKFAIPEMSASEADARLADEEFSTDLVMVYVNCLNLFNEMKKVLPAAPKQFTALGVNLLQAMAPVMKFCETEGEAK